MAAPSEHLPFYLFRHLHLIGDNSYRTFMPKGIFDFFGLSVIVKPWHKADGFTMNSRQFLSDVYAPHGMFMP